MGNPTGVKGLTFLPSWQNPLLWGKNCFCCRCIPVFIISTPRIVKTKGARIPHRSLINYADAPCFIKTKMIDFVTEIQNVFFQEFQISFVIGLTLSYALSFEDATFVYFFLPNLDSSILKVVPGLPIGLTCCFCLHKPPSIIYQSITVSAEALSSSKEVSCTA